MGDPGRRRDTLGCHVQLVDRVVAVAREVLHRASRESRGDGQLDRGGDTLGRIGETVLEVGRDRHVDCPDQGCRVHQCVVAAERAVEASQRGRRTAARRRQRLEAERGQQPRRSNVPRIRHEQWRPLQVQRQEPLGLARLITHGTCHRASSGR